MIESTTQEALTKQVGDHVFTVGPAGSVMGEFTKEQVIALLNDNLLSRVEQAYGNKFIIRLKYEYHNEYDEDRREWEAVHAGRQAPFSETTITALNTLNAYTCPNDYNDKLIAKTAGLVCPVCQYTQSFF